MLLRTTEEHQAWSRAIANEPSLLSAFKKSKNDSFNKVWNFAGLRFDSLRLFSFIIALVMPTTSRVEADISFITWRKDEIFSVLSDFLLEGVLFARQRKGLDALLGALFDF